MNTEKIRVKATINADRQKVWNYYTKPEHITKWNFADPSWHCPTAQNDMQVGGKYSARMEAKDGSFGFDFVAIYTEIIIEQQFSYGFGGRKATVMFNTVNNKTEIIIETEFIHEVQTHHSICSLYRCSYAWSKRM